MKKLKKYSVWVVAFIYAVAVITVYKTFDNLSSIKDAIVTVLSAFKPFIAAFIIAYVLNLPAVKIKGVLDKTKSEKLGFVRKHSHGISIAIIYVAAIGLLAWALSSLLPKMYQSVVNLLADMPAYIKNITTMVAGSEVFDDAMIGSIMQSAMDAVNKFAGSINVSELGKYAAGVVNATSGVLSAFVAIIASAYMLLDKENIKSATVKLFSVFMKNESKLQMLSHAREVNDIFTNYIYARLICCVVMAIACTVVLSILRIEYALILGLFIGAMDMIPYFGSIIATVVAILVAFIANGPVMGVTTGVALLIMQQIDGNILGPKVMGDSLEIRPLWIIIAVTVGGSLFGFIGMLISVPVVAVLRILFQELLNMYEEQKEKNDAE